MVTVDILKQPSMLDDRMVTVDILKQPTILDTLSRLRLWLLNQLESSAEHWHMTVPPPPHLHYIDQ